VKIPKGLLSLTTTQTEMGRALGITPGRVHQLIDEGIAIRDPKDNAGAILVIQTVKNFYSQKYLGATEDGAPDLNEERAKHEKAKREIAELKLAKLQGKVYLARTVELVMTEMASNLRTQLLGLPSKLAPILEGQKKEEIYEILTKEIEEKLSELSNYSPDLFMNSEVEEGEEDADEER
jgi:phage terminase Nu1 subunit (DNA packaging protein)